MKLKVCGMTSLEQMQSLQAAGAHFAGIIFYEKSNRFAGDKLKDQTEEIKKLAIHKVGVFVNATIDSIKNAVAVYGLNYVQLHGDESPEFCKELKAVVPVIKALRINTDTNLKPLLDAYESYVDYFLFDTDSKQYGGTGKKFNWQQLQQIYIPKPFFLSGGIGLSDTEDVLKFNHPNLIAIDVNSRFETAPGVKDIAAVTSFYHQIKK